MFRVDGNPHGKDRPRYTVINGHPADVDNSGTKTNADYYAAIKSLAGLSNSQKNYMRKVVKGK